MNESEILDIYQKVGGFRAGHFVFVSGLHADTYINKNAVYPYTGEISKICLDIANKFKGQNIDVVVGPSTGGIILSQWVAHHLSQIEGKDVYSVYADKDGEGFVIKRGYEDIVKNHTVLVVEDLVTTGGSLKKVIAEAQRVGGTVAGAVAVVNRGGVTADMIGNPPTFISLLNVHLEQWPQAECELCQADIPVNTDVGHGKEFLSKK
ncbi:MAG: phosphoribosyltransferase, orotate phosphoribosyltransferase [Candidatus Kaiserbacteria bacterium]|nr:phosphoribosyltransferase, orotate phosphoribosyltransferase [Candidatus Kaiserbacteria bacterium]